MKVLVLGSNGLVGKSVSNKLKGSKKVTELTLSNRKDTNLFNLDELKKLEGLEISGLVSEILNNNRPPTSTLGYRNPSEDISKQRNVVP